MKMGLGILTAILLLTLMTSCISVSIYDIIETGGDNEMNDITDRLMTETEMDEIRNWTREWSKDDSRFGGKNNLEYILTSPFAPALGDTDLLTIERFVFVAGNFHGGHGLVIDRMYGRIYYEPRQSSGSHGLSVLRLESVEVSAEFIEDDLKRLIQVIEAANLRAWQEHYEGRIDRNAEDGGESWNIGILFSDGTILRRSGSGMFDDFFPPQDQWTILINFIEEMGEEIQQRHQAEATRGE